MADQNYWFHHRTYVFILLISSRFYTASAQPTHSRIGDNRLVSNIKVNSLDQILDAVVKIPSGVYEAVCFGVSILSYLLLGVYRLYFHRLAGFLRPKLTAASLWYETDYDMWIKGKYMFQIKTMHKTYNTLDLCRFSDFITKR